MPMADELATAQRIWYCHSECFPSDPQNYIKFEKSLESNTFLGIEEDLTVGDVEVSPCVLIASVRAAIMDNTCSIVAIVSTLSKYSSGPFLPQARWRRAAEEARRRRLRYRRGDEGSAPCKNDMVEKHNGPFPN
jgi:hypothetical protein